jgi:hypothetical protein
MTIAEGVSGQLTFKAYATGNITSNVQPVSTVDPGATGAQILRRVSSTLNLKKDTYQSAEIRADKQIADFRHGRKFVDGSVIGELSGLTYEQFFEAACQGTWAAPVTVGPSTFTSVAADNALSTFTMTAGDPVAAGYRVGHIIQFTLMTDPDNNGKNFLITGFSGTSNRVIAVYPAPDTMAADTTFTMASIGRRLIVPTSGHVKRKFALEHYHNDLLVYQLFTECRSGGFKLGLPATGMATCEFPFMGRDMETGTATPFFTTPTAATVSGIAAAVNGLLMVQGVRVGVVTGITIDMNHNLTSDAVVGQNFVPEIIVGRANVTGQITALFEDLTLVNYFKNETEVSVLVFLTATSDIAAPSMSFLMPRVKFGGADVPMTGEASQPITMPFQALLYAGTEATTGIPATTISMCDTLVLT